MIKYVEPATSIPATLVATSYKLSVSTKVAGIDKKQYNKIIIIIIIIIIKNKKHIINSKTKKSSSATISPDRIL